MKLEQIVLTKKIKHYRHAKNDQAGWMRPGYKYNSLFSGRGES